MKTSSPPSYRNYIFGIFCFAIGSFSTLYYFSIAVPNGNLHRSIYLPPKCLTDISEYRTTVSPRPTVDLHLPENEFKVRRVRNQTDRSVAEKVFEIWNYVRSQRLDDDLKLQKQNGSHLRKAQHKFENELHERFADVISQVESIPKGKTLYWKKKVLGNLSEKLQRRIWNLQNPGPARCEPRSVISCWEQPGGFGSYLHILARCLQLGLMANKTAVLGYGELIYKVSDKQAILRPFSNCTLAILNKTGNLKIGDLPLDEDMIKNASRSISLSLLSMYLPDLIEAGVDPYMWWTGQLIRYILQPNLLASLEEQVKDIPSPRIGLHIRGSDKAGQTKLVTLDDYQSHLALVGNIFKMRTGNVGLAQNKISVYIASDDIKMLDEVATIFPQFNIIFNVTSIKPIRLRYSEESLLQFLREVVILKSSDYVLCSHISNVCRLVMELFSDRNPDSRWRALTVWGDYFAYTYNNIIEEAWWWHKSKSPDEMDLQPGDRIYRSLQHGGTSSHNLLNGYCLGKKFQEKTDRSYPCFKTVPLDSL